GVQRVTTLALADGVKLVTDGQDVRRLRDMLTTADVVHVHRGKEHWLAAVANRLAPTPRPLVRTRHIAQAVRPHAANRWLYRQATALVVTVTDAIRRQYLAAGLVDPDRVAALPGGADTERYRPQPRDGEVYRSLGGREDTLLVGMIAGLRVMKGHEVVIEAAARLNALGVRLRFVFLGRGGREQALRARISRAGLEPQISIGGFVDDLPAAMAALDVALYVPLESDGMSRVVFECLAAGRPLVASRDVVGPEFGAGVWAPVRDGAVKYRGVSAGRYPGFAWRVRDVLDLVDGDVLVASKPRPTSFGLALLARRHRRRPLVLDIDDWELG